MNIFHLEVLLSEDTFNYGSNLSVPALAQIDSVISALENTVISTKDLTTMLPFLEEIVSTLNTVRSILKNNGGVSAISALQLEILGQRAESQLIRLQRIQRNMLQDM